MSTESHLHGWGPKLAARFSNMNLNNAYKIYCLLYKKHYPKRKAMKLKPCINNLTHSLLQEGEEIRQRGVGAPPSATKNLDSSCSGEGRGIRSDSTRPAFLSPGAHCTGAVHGGTPRSSPSTVCPRALYKQQLAFKRRKKIQPD
jgi:hypothetical protein